MNTEEITAMTRQVKDLPTKAALVVVLDIVSKADDAVERAEGRIVQLEKSLEEIRKMLSR